MMAQVTTTVSVMGSGPTWNRTWVESGVPSVTTASPSTAWRSGGRRESPTKPPSKAPAPCVANAQNTEDGTGDVGPRAAEAAATAAPPLV